MNCSRTEEKKVLGQLNSRLAAYIEKVRSLELENGRLEQQVVKPEQLKIRANFALLPGREVNQ